MLKKSKLNICDRIIFSGIILLLVVAPLAFGSVHVWAYTILEIGVFSLLALWFANRLFFSGPDAFEWVQTPANLALILFLVVIGLQMVPLPASLISVISPRTFHDKMQLSFIMEKAAESAALSSNWIIPSYYFHATLVEWLKLAAYLGMFFLVLNTARSKKRIDIIVYVLILVGLLEAIYAVYAISSNKPMVLWWKSRVGVEHHYASGTFIGSNHFAGYMVMIICLAFGLMIAQKTETKRLLSGLGGTRAFLQRMVSWFSPESGHPKMIILFFMAALMGAALLLSASRGGIITLGASLLLMSVLFLSKQKYRKFGGLALGLCLFSLIYGLHIGITPTLGKFTRYQGLHNRLDTTKNILPMFMDYPLTGVGWGNFQYLYPRYIYDDDRVSSSGYAHNDWVEAGIEVGLAGAILVSVAFAVYLFKMIRIWRRRRDLYAIGIGAGAISGLIAVGLHSFFDFNMHIPANPLTLAALLGIGYAALHKKGHGYIETFFYKVRKMPLSRIQRIAMGCTALLFCFACIFTAGRNLLAEGYCPVEWNSTLNLNWNPELADIQSAIAYNPGNAEYYFKQANYFIQLRHPSEQEELKAQRQKSKKPKAHTGQTFRTTQASADATDVEVPSIIQKMQTLPEEAFRKAKNERIVESLEKAVQLNPARGIYWYELGKHYSLRIYDPYSYLKKWLPLTEKCFDMALQCAPKDANMLFEVAWYWVWRSSLLPSKNSDLLVGKNSVRKSIQFQEEGIYKFQQLFQRSFSLDPDNWKKAVDRVWEYYPHDEVVLEIVPSDNESLKSSVLKALAKKE